MKLTKPLGILVLLVATVWMTVSFLRSKEEKVLGLVSPTVILTPTASVSAEISPIASVSATPTEIINVTPTASVSATPTKKPTLKLTPTPTTTDSQTINNFVERFAAQYGVDRNVLRHIAICESGFRSNAVNGPYVGLFQFGSSTWSNIRKEMNEDSDPLLRFSAEESVQTAAYALSKGKGKIWPNCMP